MIDIRKESLLSLPQARKWLAERGIKRDRTSLYRWAEDGSLETVRFGGRLYTSIEALERMCQPPPRQKQVRRRKAAAGSREAYERAMANLRARGFRV